MKKQLVKHLDLLVQHATVQTLSKQQLGRLKGGNDGSSSDDSDNAAFVITEEALDG